MKKKSNIAVVILILAVLGSFGLLALGGHGRRSETPTDRVTRPGSTEAQPIEAPDFTLANLKGNPLTLSAFRGEKAVILDFFATWCPNCRRDIPNESRLYEKYRDQIEVLGVNLQEDPQTVAAYAQKENVSFPIVLDPTGLASKLYGVQYTNFHVLINKTGRIVKFIPGDIKESHFEELLNT